MRTEVIGVVGVVMLCMAVPCSAQNAASLAINAGSATDVTGVGSSALTIAPSIARGSTRSTASLGASATKFANDAWSAAIMTSLSGRASDRAISPTLDAALTAATTSYDFSYASAELVPGIEGKARGARLFVGARLAAAGTSSILSASGGSPALPVPGGSRSNQSSAGRAIVGGGAVTMVAANGEVSTIGYRGEAGVVANARQQEHTVSASVANSAIVVGGSVSTRVRLAQRSTHGVATLGVAINPSVMLQVSAGGYPSNPMLGTAAGRFVNAGLTMRMGRRTGSMPPARGAAPAAQGLTRISIRAGDAQRVELAGDFSKWQPIAATRANDGVWYADVRLMPGEYRYAFRINGKEWRVPDGVAAVDDEFGGKSAWLKVGPASKGSSP